MKDILITLSPTVERDLVFCKTFLEETELYDKGLTQLHDKAFLLSGPKSFEIAMSLSHMLSENEIQFVICEVESVLLYQSHEIEEENLLKP